MEQTGDMLISIMADKTQSTETIDAAFHTFCAKYDSRLLHLVEVQCTKLGYSAEIAFKAVECTFARVRRYPTFEKVKSKCKDLDNAIIIWLNKIAYTQILKFKNNKECAEVSKDEDLSVVNNATEFYEVQANYKYMTDDAKDEKIAMLNRVLSSMEDKHRIILLTYLAYESLYKTLPRTLLLKLRNQLNLTQNSIRVYKKEAFDLINNNN